MQDPWGSVGDTTAGYMDDASFKSSMDGIYGPGNWRQSGGWRSQARENQLRTQGAQTTAPGVTSAHSLGTLNAPGARDITVNGESPQIAAAQLQAHRFPAAQVYPEGAAGGQGGHLHIGMDPSINPPGGPPAADPWASVGASTPQIQRPGATPAPAAPTREAGDPELYKVILQEAGPNATPRHIAALASEFVNRSAQSGQSYIGVVTARDQYGPGYSSDTAEGKGWERVQSLPDNDPRLQRIAAVADPYLTRQVQPLPYTGHWSPGAAAATDESRPGWADDTGTPIGGNLFYSHPYGPGGQPAADPWASVGAATPTVQRPAPQEDQWASVGGQAALAAQPKPSPKRDLMGEGSRLLGGFVGSAETAGAQMLRGFGGIGDIVAQDMAAQAAGQGTITDPLTGVAEPVPEAIRPGMASIATQRTPVASPQVERLAAPMSEQGSSMTPTDMNFGEKLVAGAGGFVPLIGASLIDPLAGVAAFGAQGYEQSHAEALKAGKPEETAQSAGLANAGISMGAGALPLGPVLSPIVGRVGGGVIARVAARTAAAAAENAAQMGAMTAGSNVVAQKYYDPTRGTWQDVPEAAASGALAGGLIHGGHEAFAGVKGAFAGAPAATAEAQAQPLPATDAVQAYTDLTARQTAPGGPYGPPAEEAGAGAPAPPGGPPAPPDTSAAAIPQAPPPDYEAARAAEGAPLERMPAAINDVAAARTAPPQGPNLFQAIKSLGGIRNRDAAGTLDSDLMEALGEKRGPPGMINNKTGLSPDDMRLALQEQGWFGPGREDLGTTPNDLHDLIDRHVRNGPLTLQSLQDPASFEEHASRQNELDQAGVGSTDTDAVAASKLAAFRQEQDQASGPSMEALRDRAANLGLPHTEAMAYDELLGDVVEREAIQHENTDGFADDHDEREIDTVLTPDEHEWLSAAERGPRGEPGPTEGPKGPGRGPAPERATAQGHQELGQGAGGGGGEAGAFPEGSKLAHVDPEAIANAWAKGWAPFADRYHEVEQAAENGGRLTVPSPEFTREVSGQPFEEHLRAGASFDNGDGKGDPWASVGSPEAADRPVPNKTPREATEASEKARAAADQPPAPEGKPLPPTTPAVRNRVVREELAGKKKKADEYDALGMTDAERARAFNRQTEADRETKRGWDFKTKFPPETAREGQPSVYRHGPTEEDQRGLHQETARLLIQDRNARDAADNALGANVDPKDGKPLTAERRKALQAEAHELDQHIQDTLDSYQDRFGKLAREAFEAHVWREAAVETQARPEPTSEKMDLGGEKVDQLLIPGGEQSARQAAQARGETLRPRVAQEGPGDLFAPPEPPQPGLFDQPEPKGGNAALEPEAREAKAVKEGPKPGEGYGDKNKVFTRESRDEALKKLREIARRSNAGVDPELVHSGIMLAGYHVEAGARVFADYARAMLQDLGEWSAPYLKMWYNALRDYPGFGADGMTPTHEITDQSLEEAWRDVRDSGVGLEPGSEGTTAADRHGEAAVPNGPGGPERGAPAEGSGPEGAGGGPAGGVGLPDRGAAPVGEERAGELFAGSPGAVGRAAERGEPGGSNDVGNEGIQPERIPATEFADAADDAAHLEPVAPSAHPDAASVDAPPVPHELDEALPTLFPEQRADVAFAEERFAKDDGHGVLFTNGTGTGKTFSGGGIVKRFHDAGKGDVLVIAPSQGILDHWRATMENLKVPFDVLEDTAGAGEPGRPTGTTYANLANNRTLADRKWDLVVADEAHNLSSNATGDETTGLQNFRAITHHPDRLQAKARMQLRDVVDRVDAMRAALGKNPPEALARQWEDAQRALDAEVKQRAEMTAAEPRPKAVFLSATPFAYDKSIDYAEKYLFNYGPETDRMRYNGGSPRDQFMMRNFGYRMRFNKLTRPDNAVESDVMERQFHEWMRRAGALSGRVLTVDKDYDRKFVLTPDAEGSQIDKALDFLHSADDGKFLPLADAVRKRFDYLARARLLEAMKAKAAIPIIERHLALGRKVVVFHNYNVGGGFAPFEYGSEMESSARYDQKTLKQVPIRQLHDEFVARNPYAKDIDQHVAGLESPLEQLQAHFPDAMAYNGTVPRGQRAKAIEQFNQDGGRKNLIIVQSEAGQAGISLHDTTGQHQRVTLNLGMPGRPTAAIQQEGRTYRIGQASDAIFRYMNTGTNWERSAFAQTIAQRAGTAENLALGDQARTMRESFINAFLESAPNPPARGEGKGGKAADRQLAKALSAFQKAKSFYFAEGKKTGGRASREGVDYFPTPEPLGLKMVEWADARPGEHMLEPSAGHGAIARFFPETTSRTLVEPSPNLASRAELSSPGARVLVSKFEDLHAVNKYHAIVMNPPFGTAGATAIAHLEKAALHLADGGRIVALIPHGATDAKFERLMESDAFKHIYKAADINLPASTFERAGTKISAHVVVLERVNDAGAPKPQEVQRDFSNAENITQLFDRLEDTSIPDRLAPISADLDPQPAQRIEVSRAAKPATSFETGQTVHSKTGEDLFVASPRVRVSSDDYKATLAIAKGHDGYYSSWRGPGAIPGFQFKTEADRQAFLDETNAQRRAEISGDGASFDRAVPLYSAVQRTVERSQQKVATPEQWRSTLENAPGVKREELEWTGVNDWLDMMKGQKVTKAAVQAFLSEHGVRVEEKVLGAELRDQARYHHASDEDLEELATGQAQDRYHQAVSQAHDELGDEPEYMAWTLPGASDYRELLFTLPDEATPPATHWSTPGVMAHVRFDSRTAPDGKKVLFVEEVQSDWHKLGREQGYAKPGTQEQLDAAAKAHDRAVDALKATTDRILPMADDVWRHEAGARDPSNAPWRAGWHPNIEDNPTRMNSKVEAVRNWIVRSVDRPPAPLDRLLVQHRGESLRVNEALQAYRIAEGSAGIPDAPFKSSWPALTMRRMIVWAADHGFDRVAWTTGDQQNDRYPGRPEEAQAGMRAFYDRNLVNITNDIIKRYGEKVSDGHVDTHAETGRAFAEGQRATPEGLKDAVRAGQVAESHGFDVTDRMREAATQGLPLFNRPAEPPAAPAGRRPLAEGVLPTDTPEVARMIKQVHDIIGRIAPKVEVKAYASLTEKATGAPISGMFVRDGDKNLIAWALDSADHPSLARHESVHYLRQLKFFKPAEWSALESTASSENWMQRYNIERLYPDLGPEKQMEEAIAERYGDWGRGVGDVHDLPTFVRALFQRIQRALGAIADATRQALGKGVTAEDVFRRIESGEVGARTPGEPGAAGDSVSFARAPKEEGDTRSFVNRILGEGLDTVGHKVDRAAARFLPDPLIELTEHVRMGLNPMAAGSARAQATAKDFANTMRENTWAWNRVDTQLEKTFTRDEREAMWRAADEESVLLQLGAEVKDGQGLSRLTPPQRAVVKELQARANDAFQRAQQLGMTKAEGLPSYVPRMVVEMTAEGGARRVGARARATTPEGAGRNLTTTTGNLRQRKYLTTEETEGAAREAFGENAAVITDIRTLAHATGALEQAIAGRRLINTIKEMGKSGGEELVQEGGRTNEGAFTLDHPAMKVWGPKFVVEHETGKLSTIRDPSTGGVVMEAKPLYVSKEFEGPLRAVLTKPTGMLEKGLMSLKGKIMSVIMYSPLMHNAVIWGKALSANPVSVLTFDVYREGYRAKNDVDTMREALRAGVDPIGRRYFNQDITALVEQPQISAGRSWTAQLLGSPVGWVNREAGTAVKETIDKLGDLWHNTFLWDRVADLQMGLYTRLRDSFTSHGLDPQSAQRVAAHFANRYAGALPIEAMSKMARTTANLALFSRSFTMTNIGAWKDAVAGLPTDVQAQIERDAGLKGLQRAQGTARGKAMSLIVLDVALAHLGLLLASSAVYGVHQLLSSPQPFHPEWDNEPGKQDRFLIGYGADGTGIYGRLPTGKVAEDLVTWVTDPLGTEQRKLSPFAKFAMELQSNDKGFGRKLYDPYDQTAAGDLRNISRVVLGADISNVRSPDDFSGGLLGSVAPVGVVQGVAHLGSKNRQEGSTALLQTMLPLFGITVSKGSPGGPASGDIYRALDEQTFRLNEAMPGVREQIRQGDVQGARQRLSTLGVIGKRATYIISAAQHPGVRITGRELLKFKSAAAAVDPGDQGQFQQDEQDQRARQGVTP